MSSVMVQKYKAILSGFEKKLEINLNANVGRCFLSQSFPFGATLASGRLGIILGRPKV